YSYSNKHLQLIQFPELASPTNLTNPKSLQVISKDIETITELRDGNLLLLVKDKKSANKFISTKQLPGTVFAPYLKNLSDEEIKKELAAEGVVDIFKFTRMIENKAVPSGVILLTFDLYRLPETIDISWHKARVREYFPNPMRCKLCQRLGHTKKHCSNDPLCEICSRPPHQNDCDRIKCANCDEDHAANSNKCPKFVQQKEILKIKIQRKCTLKQAREMYSAQFPRASPPLSFAAKANSINNNITTQANNNNSNNEPTNKIDENTIKKTSLNEEPSSTPQNLDKPSSEQTTTFLKTATTHKSTNPTTASLITDSPMTRISQQLIQSNSYFISPSSVDENLN
ncbi:PREDICTED: uncharacterized protein LOC108355773, partial [Rhagoletis zephyria]|uniref:uncharacterized protein LOC108355773 n=1 Tax=Rhagoletis zephyria TaxID=28612 RepID=UPI000811859F